MTHWNIFQLIKAGLVRYLNVNVLPCRLASCHLECTPSALPNFQAGTSNIVCAVQQVALKCRGGERTFSKFRLLPFLQMVLPCAAATLNWSGGTSYPIFTVPTVTIAGIFSEIHQNMLSILFATQHPFFLSFFYLLFSLFSRTSASLNCRSCAQSVY